MTCPSPNILRLEAPAPYKQDIVRVLASLGQTLGTLAHNAGEPVNTLYGAMHGSSSLRGEIIIAEFLEIDPRVLWPDRWARWTPAREQWLLKNTEKLAEWAGKRLEDVERPSLPGAPANASWEIPRSCGLEVTGTPWQMRHDVFSGDEGKLDCPIIQNQEAVLAPAKIEEIDARLHELAIADMSGSAVNTAPATASLEIPHCSGLTAGKTARFLPDLRARLRGLITPGPAGRPRLFSGKQAR
jgi:lambda repressor-like predicted transcriptional regulator